MGAFLGCCVIAATVWYVGRKIARAVTFCGIMLENIGKHGLRERWPSDDAWERAFKG